MREHRPRTERARDGYQVPRPAPIRMNTGTLESYYVRRLTPAEDKMRMTCIALGADLVAVEGGYCITDTYRTVLTRVSTLPAVRAWIVGQQLAGG